MCGAGSSSIDVNVNRVHSGLNKLDIKAHIQVSEVDGKLYGVGGKVNCAQTIMATF